MKKFLGNLFIMLIFSIIFYSCSGEKHKYIIVHNNITDDTTEFRADYIVRENIDKENILLTFKVYKNNKDVGCYQAKIGKFWTEEIYK